MKSNRSEQWLRWLLPAGLAALAAGLWTTLTIQAAEVRAGRPSAESDGGVFVAAGRISSETGGLYLVDYNQKTISVYQVVPTAKKDVLRLMASRTYAFDVRLDDYNTSPPPREIRRLVEQHKRLGEP